MPQAPFHSPGKKSRFPTLCSPTLACALLAFVIRSSISPATDPLMSRQTPRYVAFFFGTNLCPPTVITIFPALISRFVRAFPCPTASSKISNFPTLALRWFASKTSMTAWIHPVRCSHDLKMRNGQKVVNEGNSRSQVPPLRLQIWSPCCAH